MSMRTGVRSSSAATPSRRRCGVIFARNDFIEVDTATLQVSPGNEAHLHAFETEALDDSDGKAIASLSAHLAGVRLQEAARSRRGTDRLFRSCLPQSRARAAAPSGIHHAGMVPGRGRLRGP
jgi:hypothetical protein